MKVTNVKKALETVYLQLSYKLASITLITLYSHLMSPLIPYLKPNYITIQLNQKTMINMKLTLLIRRLDI
jgi:hypothetical protein